MKKQTKKQTKPKVNKSTKKSVKSVKSNGFLKDSDGFLKESFKETANIFSNINSQIFNRRKK